MAYTGPIVSVADGGTGSNTAAGARTNLGITAVATQTLTQYAALVGGAANAITSIGPGTAGQVLQSGGAAANPAYSTATFPATATGTGTILRADGTNWAATTATYPATTTINQILYSSAANTIGGITTASSGVLTTSSTGVPSIDTTNFQVLTTGVQVKGNNTNTAPPTGFIGELISATATTGALTNNTVANVTSVSLTAGIWDISARCEFATTGTVAGNVQWILAISTVTASLGSLVGEYGSTQDGGKLPVNGVNSVGVWTGPTRATLSATTTIYLNCRGASTSTFTNVTCTGVIRAVRVG